MSKGLFAKTFQGVKWSSASTIFNALMQIGYTAIMSRLLDDVAFGLVGMADIIMRFVEYFARMGMYQALIQKSNLTRNDIRVAFTSSMILGICFAVLVYFLAPLSNLIFDEPELIPVIRIIAFSQLINGMFSTSISLMRRDLRFKELAVGQTIAYIIAYGVVGVSLAFNGYGVYSLVYATLSLHFINGLIAFILRRHPVTPIFKWKYYKPLLSYGGGISIISFIEFIVQSFDSLLIGKFLGAGRLGVYSRARMLVFLPMFYIQQTLSNVVFPSFSKIQEDIPKLTKAYLSTITLLSTILLPICFGISAASKQIVYIVLGSEWEEAVDILKILAFAIPLANISFFSGVICEATAHLKEKVIVLITQVIVLASMFYLFYDLGLLGFALALVIGEWFRTFSYFIVIKNILKISFLSQIKAYFPGIFNGMVTGVSILIITMAIEEMGGGLWIIFIAQLIVGIITQVLVVFFFPQGVLLNQILSFIEKIDISKLNNKFYFKYLLWYSQYISNRKS